MFGVVSWVQAGGGILGGREGGDCCGIEVCHFNIIIIVIFLYLRYVC